jgi:hypothetical protein
LTEVDVSNRPSTEDTAALETFREREIEVAVANVECEPAFLSRKRLPGST